MEEKMLQEMLGLLRSLEQRLEEGSNRPRDTTVLPKAEWVKWVMREVLSDQHRNCTTDCKERLKEIKQALEKEITANKGQIKTLEDTITGVSKTTDATKTTTNNVISMAEFVDSLRKLNLVQWHDEFFEDDGLKEQIEYSYSWIIDEEDRRAAALNSSRFKISTMLTIIGIMLAFGMGLAALIVNIYQG